MAIEEENIQNTPDRDKNVNSDYNKRMTMNNHPDPTAKRNMGPGGTTERSGQKGKLENMHIRGNEVTGYGANDPKSTDYMAQGPGFEYEGSDTAMDDNLNGIRSQEQPLGQKRTNPDDDTDHSRT
ncbi:hypothetical protein H7F15_06805 [Pontibacter sp. Tf4]|uniref:hypothetical protein n=1 Tax=Pontibacter sp. Tf4 TaxID=2761620 RepID=UPI001629EE11|nr:hypothetical protein [Pontibacter sp. Tf4]MBB6610741.1 hypothetical protein [Pontibacter sp. Tf4]